MPSTGSACSSSMCTVQAHDGCVTTKDVLPTPWASPCQCWTLYIHQGTLYSNFCKKESVCCGHVRGVKATGGRVDPQACPGHWLLPSNRQSSQLSGCGPLVRAVRAVVVVAVEALGGQEEDLARGRDPEGEQHSAVALSTVSFSSFASLFTRSSSTIRHTKTGNCPFQRCSNRSSRPVNIFHQQTQSPKSDPLDFMLILLEWGSGGAVVAFGDGLPLLLLNCLVICQCHEHCVEPYTELPPVTVAQW